jgi:endoglucanase
MKRGAIAWFSIWGALAAAACGDRSPSSAGGGGPADGQDDDPSQASDGGGLLDGAADGAAPGDGGTPPGVNPFVHSEAEKLIDGRGQPLLWRTVGLGNWLLPEGYMWRLEGTRGDRPRRIEARVEELIGEPAAAAFWQSFRERYITEADIERIAALGFNSVRPALNARLLLPEGQEAFDEGQFALLEQLVGWCKKAGLHVILDMHAAPGGQTGKNIDDSEADYPNLFTKVENQDRLERLWVELATRFADEPAVAGYDLLNEPLPAEFLPMHGAQLWPLYQRLGAAIREVDPNHMLIVEGGNWANDWSTLGPPFDDNMMYSFHKYWNASDISSIQGYLSYREQWKRPVWVGEIGENTNEWYEANFQLLEDHDIGWAFWPWKKLDATNNPLAIRPPARWHLIQSYVIDANQKPSAADAQAVLDELLAWLPFDKNRENAEVLCSLPAAIASRAGCD